MEKFFSKIENNQLLHLISTIKDGDFNKHVSIPEEKIQTCRLKFSKGHEIKRHYHLEREPAKISNLSQESLFIIKGFLQIDLYDLDYTILKKVNLYEGDIYIFYNGFYQFKSKAKETVIYKIKS